MLSKGGNSLFERVIIMHDWDGTDVDTMPSHANLAAKVIKKYFGTSLRKAREQYLETTGVPFDKQLEKIFPHSSKAKRDCCANEYHFRKIGEVYERPKTFPSVKEALRVSSAVGFISIISSSTEENLINAWAYRKKLSQYFSAIYGREHGTKTEHIRIVEKMYPNCVVFFLSDSVGDMNLPAVTIGVCVPKEKEQEFYGAGANWVFSTPPSIEVIEKIQSIL